MIPPQVIPNVAAVIASVPAPITPAFSKSGAKAMPVAGPPTKVTDPAITPSSGFTPNADEIPIPMKF